MLDAGTHRVRVTACRVVKAQAVGTNEPRRWYVYADSADRAIDGTKPFIDLHLGPWPADASKHGQRLRVAYAVVQVAVAAAQRNRKTAADTDRRKVLRDAGVTKLTDLDCPMPRSRTWRCVRYDAGAGPAGCTCPTCAPQASEPKPTPLPDAVRTAPQTVITNAAVRAKLRLWLAWLDGEAPPAGVIGGPPPENVGELVRVIHEKADAWVCELNDDEYGGDGEAD